MFGLRADAAAGRLVWDVRLLEEHGVENYPFAGSGTLSLLCLARSSAGERPVIEAKSDIPLELVVRWEGGEETHHLVPSPPAA